MRRKTDSGFSLLEALVAMSILSVSAATLLSAVEEHTRAIAAYSDRATARWIAENRLVELGLGLSDLTDIVQSDGRDWWVSTVRSNTSDSELSRVEISVSPVSERNSALVRLTGFIENAGGAK